MLRRSISLGIHRNIAWERGDARSGNGHWNCFFGDVIRKDINSGRIAWRSMPNQAMSTVFAP
jgi:hypothetical protein